jgi:hypothetical protein
MNSAIDAGSAIAAFERKIIKDKLRFAVGKTSDGHSGVWSAFNGKNEFYLGARGMFNNTKVTLHKSGFCRFALTETGADSVDPRALPAPNDRVFVRWKRPPAPAQGAHLAVSVCFPTDYLRMPPPKGSAKKPILIFEAAPPRKAVQCGFFFSREGASTLESKFLEIGKPIFSWDLPNGESVWLVATEADFDASVLPEASSSLRALDPADLLAPGTERKNLTAVFWNAPQDGDPLQMIEIGGVTVRGN